MVQEAVDYDLIVNIIITFSDEFWERLERVVSVLAQVNLQS